MISRQDAKKQGLPRYFTGKACIQGHIAERYTNSKSCCVCGNQQANQSKAKNRAKYSKSSSNWKKLNPIKVADYQRARAPKIKGQRNLWTANYRSAKDSRTPAWLTPIDFERMENEYKLAALQTKITGTIWHVDHIIPLRGKNVSGFHVPSNLKAIPGVENVRKNNHYGV